ncbi:MAG: SDR family NAD(P)-dependent oxidoreductase [Bacteroidota bacterium]
MPEWDERHLPADLSGKVYAITGTSSGIGAHIAYQLGKRGATVLTGNRNLEKAENALKQLSREGDSYPGIRHFLCDLSSLDAVRAFAASIYATEHQHLDGLILNAGIMALPEKHVSVDGLELQMATNVVGHHLLTALLLPLLLRSPAVAKVISVSSLASNQVKDPALWDDLNAHVNYRPWEVYGLTKIAAIQFRQGLRKLLALHAQNHRVHVLSTHPGLTATPLFNAPRGFSSTIFRAIRGLFMMPPEKGALPTLRALLDDTIPDGSLLGPGGFTGTGGYPKVIPDFNQYLALDPGLIEKLWNYCDRVTTAQWNFTPAAQA